MASTGHLWRTTRLNTRKNSTRTSVASVLRAERVRAAATGASALGIATDVEFLGAAASNAVPRTKRVVAFSDSVTVHILPACELEDAELARSSNDAFCTTCQAYIDLDAVTAVNDPSTPYTPNPYNNNPNFNSDDRMYYKLKNAISPHKTNNNPSPWTFLRNVDELESRNRHCMCDKSRYPEYGAGTDEFVLADDDDDSANPHIHNIHRNNDSLALVNRAIPPPIEMDDPDPPPVQRERSLRFTSRSRARARELALPPPGAEASMGVGPSQQPTSPFPPLPLPVENLPLPLAENHPLPIAMPLVRCTSNSALELHSPKSDPTDDERSDDTANTKNSKKQKKPKRPSRDASRIQPSLSEIRRQMLDEMELADPDDEALVDEKQICLNRRSRTLPAPVSRAPRPTPGRLSSLSDIDCSDQNLNHDHPLYKNDPVNVDPRLKALIGVTSGAGTTKQLSKLTPPHVSPSEDNSNNSASRGPSFTRIFSDNRSSNPDHEGAYSHGDGNDEKFALPPSAVVVVPESSENKLSPSVYATKRKITTKRVLSKEVVGGGGVGASSYSISMSENSGLSTVSTQMSSFEEENGTQGRLRFRSRRTRAAAAAAVENGIRTGSGSAGAAQDAQKIVKKEKERERSFAGFGGSGAREISGLSTTGTGFMERREEFSANSPRGTENNNNGTSNNNNGIIGERGPRFSRAVRTDLGHLGHISNNNNNTTVEQRRHNAEKESLPRRLAGLRSLRERVSKLMGRGTSNSSYSTSGYKISNNNNTNSHNNNNNNQNNIHTKPTTSMRMNSDVEPRRGNNNGMSHQHQSVAEKLGRQLCLPSDAY